LKAHAVEAGLPGPHQQLGLAVAVQQGRLGLGDGLHAQDVAAAAAVEEVAIHGVRQVCALDEAAEALDVLAPVGHQLRLVEQVGHQRLAVHRLRLLGLLGEADEDSHGRADPFDGLGAAIDFFNIDAW
jgi:hypothetical protein